LNKVKYMNDEIPEYEKFYMLSNLVDLSSAHKSLLHSQQNLIHEA